MYVKKNRINFADFSRRCNFASRGFVSEYLSGKKRLSSDSLQKIKKALKLQRPYPRIFELLVLLDQEELRSRYQTEAKLLNKLCEARSLISKPVSLTKANSKSLISNETLIQVFAASGTIEEGSSFDDLLQRTKLSTKDVEQSIEILIKNNILKISEGRYLPVAPQIDLDGLCAKTGFPDLITNVSKKIAKNANTISANKSNHLFYSAFSLSRSEVFKFKKDLKEAVFEVLDNYQKDEGDIVVEQVFLGAWHN